MREAASLVAEIVFEWREARLQGGIAKIFWNPLNRRCDITDDPAMSNAAQFRLRTKQLGINYFPAHDPVLTNFVDFRLRVARWPNKNIGSGYNIHIVLDFAWLTCNKRRVQTGRVWGCSFIGGSEIAGRRIARKRPASLQAESATRGHHQRGEAPLFLPEAGREKARKRSVGAEAQP